MNQMKNIFRVKFAAVLSCAIALAGTVAVECLAAADTAICGKWRTVINRPGGQSITVDWTIEPSGNYKVSANGQYETGTMTTTGNSYVKTTNIGPDRGTYQVMSDREFSTTGKFGYTVWTRVGGGAGGGATIASAKNAISNVYNKYKDAYGGGSGGGGYGSSGSYNQSSGYDQSSNNSYDPTKGYDPGMNPRSQKWAAMGFGQAGTTKDQSGFDYAAADRASRGYSAGSAFAGQDLKSLLFGNFPIKSGGDEVEQFGLPALGKAAAGGMRKREFRLIQ